MKKHSLFLVIFSIVIFLSGSFLYAEEKSEDTEDKPKYEYTKEKQVAAKRRPNKADNDKIISLNTKDDKTSADDYIKKCQDTFKYGLESQISELIDELTKNEDTRFVDYIYDLFYETKTPGIRNKILDYFGKLKDPCLSDFACEVINDPYDENKETVEKCFKYVADVKCVEAVPGLVDLVDKEEDDYFNGALTALGELGTQDEAQFLAEYMKRDDLSNPQKQALMKVLGKIKAIETWDQIKEIAENEDENSYVRQYAVEALGAMQKPEGEEVILKLYETNDANLRVYVIKGISYFDDDAAKKMIIQGLRDSQYKVRLESVNKVKDKDMKEATPYLIYRCKDKEENTQVKDKSLETLAYLNTKEGNEYLISQITDKKVGDTTKYKVAKYLLEYNHCGTEEIIALAKETFENDIRKNLRYQLGKEFAKYGRPEMEEICKVYLESEDVQTQGTGIDIWAKGKYKSLRPMIEDLAKQVEEEEKAKEAAAEAKKNEKKDAFGITINPTAPVKKFNANAKKAKRTLEQVDSFSKN